MTINTRISGNAVFSATATSVRVTLLPSGGDVGWAALLTEAPVSVVGDTSLSSRPPGATLVAVVGERFRTELSPTPGSDCGSPGVGPERESTSVKRSALELGAAGARRVPFELAGAAEVLGGDASGALGGLGAARSKL